MDERFKKVVADKNALAAQIETLQSELVKRDERIASLEPAANALTQALEQEKAGRLAAETRFGRFTSAASHGITDPDLVEFAESKWAKLPDDGRPAFGDWLGALKAKPEEAPTPLRLAWSVETVAKPATPAPPTPNAGVVGVATGGEFKAGDIAKMTPEQYVAWKKANGLR